MRLLYQSDNDTFAHTENYTGHIPSYAILSHTWGPDVEEVTFGDLVGSTTRKNGYRKLQLCNDWAKQDGLRYFWVDTCCIDKANLTELSESITSMFKWYQYSSQCYVYLSDVSQRDDTEEWKRTFRKSRWFKRGWTLQELLAPRTVKFFSKEGDFLGDRSSLEPLVHAATNIPIAALRGTVSLSEYSIKERFSWAENRQTTRSEDQAYCLQGLFGISIAVLYGENLYGQGNNALRRLRRAIEESRVDVVETVPDEKSISNSKYLPIIKQQELLDILRFDAIDDRYTSIKERLDRTCEWFLQTDQYRDWLDVSKIDQHHGFFWIKGKPGCGKSTLAKAVLSGLREEFSSTVFLSFFFNARGTELEKNMQGLFRSLSLQILESNRSLMHENLISPSNINTKLQSNIAKLKALLSKALRMINKKVIIIIDALDECDEDEVRDMIGFFEQMGEFQEVRSKLRILFISRPYPHITLHKSLELRVENQKGHDSDIDRYLAVKLRLGDSVELDAIRQEILKRASGVFIWVRLVVDLLNKAYDRGQIHKLREKLEELPTDLHQLFKDILTRDCENTLETRLCIEWLLFSTRPLTPDELYFAVLGASDPDIFGTLDIRRISHRTVDLFILHASKGLAEPTRSQNRNVQFIHESVRDFLLKGDGIQDMFPEIGEKAFGLIHERIRGCCVHYLSCGIFDPQTCRPLPPPLRNSASERFPFLRYAIKGCFAHSNTAQSCGLSQRSFLEGFDLQNWARLSNFLGQDSHYDHDPDLLYVLAATNNPHLLRAAADGGANILSRKGGQYHNPVSAAIAEGSAEAFEELIALQMQHVRPNSKIQFPDPLIMDILSKFSQHHINRFLSLYEIRLQQSEILSRLNLAAAKNEDDVVRLLLCAKPEVVTLLQSDNGALYAASEAGHQSVVRLLIEAGATDKESRSGENETALEVAHRLSYHTIALMLVDAEAAGVLKASRGRTLLKAVRQGSHSLVKLLLSVRASISNAELHDATVLAARCWDSPAMVETLIDATSTTRRQLETLHAAIDIATKCGHLKVVSGLLKKANSMKTKDGGWR